MAEKFCFVYNEHWWSNHQLSFRNQLKILTKERQKLNFEFLKHLLLLYVCAERKNFSNFEGNVREIGLQLACAEAWILVVFQRELCGALLESLSVCISQIFEQTYPKLYVNSYYTQLRLQQLRL